MTPGILRSAKLLSVLLTSTAPLAAQRTPLASEAAKFGGSPNVHVLSHIQLGGFFHTGGLDMEADPARPFVYVTRILEDAGFTIVSLADPRKPKIVYDWRIPNAQQHAGLGGEAGKHFKVNGRYYYAKAFQFEANTPDADLSMAVFDVTSLPDATKVKEVARVHAGSVTHIFAYKHSNGRVYLFATTTTKKGVSIYDADKLVRGDPNEALVAEIPVPGQQPVRSMDGSVRVPWYHDTYVAFDPARNRDVLYGAGTGGYYVWDVTTPEEPKQITSLTPGSGVSATGHSIQASPDGRYAVGQVERAYFPVMVFDLKPALDGHAPLIPNPIGAWTADWKDASHDHELRWPYAFVASFEDGLQVVSMSDPKDPKTIGWFYTCECTHNEGWGGRASPHGTTSLNGAADVDIRNTDGLIVLSDYTSGLWVFKIDGFDGWNGNNYRLPNISSEQDWDNGPVKQSGIAPKPATD